ncbi:hypothetical protein AMS68_006730 [Peltaster fructicola]|uniref:PWI domain-containing protein n=1 Tax=Peltaster fructicola TaxID=286661 RepID=A0A6H0Y2G5_9PEZI|nr:hypothetical protein AMS68_006730 [Peltaster fructicola]
MAFPYGAPGAYGFDQNARSNGAGPQGGFAPQYQGNAGMQFNAPVIRMGLDNGNEARGGRYDNRNRAGLGADSGGSRNLDRDRQQIRENMLAAQPPTREEVARTIFIGGLGESAPPDEALESILGCAGPGKLRRWTRAKDVNDKKCRFGFAEFTDVDSLETAKDLFGDGMEVPLYKDGKIVLEDAAEGEQAQMQMTKLLVVIDEQSSKYIVEWTSKRDDPEGERQFRLEAAKEDLTQCFASLRNGTAFGYNSALADGEAGDGMDAAAAVVDITVSSLDDELADIPAEMRATVAQEIKNFRDRSNRRDQERVRQDEELEASFARPSNRLASPGPNTNGARSGVTGAPSGPKGLQSYRGVQLPSDYANGVSFVGLNAQPEDDSDTPDAELEDRRQTARAAALDKQFSDAERRWINRERQRMAAQERERTREDAETRDRDRHKGAMERRYSTWNDEEEDRHGREEYYYDRSGWARKRAVQRDREAREDDRDRQLQQREDEEERRRDDESKGAADRFLAETGAELAAAKQIGAAGGFKIALGGPGRPKAGGQPAKTIKDVAGLLEEEEDAAESGQRELRAIPLADLTSHAPADMTDEERTAARQALAAEIPTDAEKLFAWEVRWSYIRPELLEREIRPFVEKKVVEFLGVQEDFLVDIVINALNKQTTAENLISQLEKILDEDAEGLVKKVWRLVVYFGEAEGQGLM